MTAKFDLKKALGAGTEDIDRSILGMPFLGIIQKGSPEIDKTHSKYEQKKIDGCAIGDIVFAPERKVLAQPLVIVPLAQTALYTVWRPKNAGGGFIGYQEDTVVTHRDYRRGTREQNTEYKEYLNENELIYTIFFFLMFENEGKWTKGIIPFTGTQLKHARNWLQAILPFRYPEMPDANPPIFARSWELSTKAESNAKGGWMSWKIEKPKVLDPEADCSTLEQAFEFHKDAQLSLPKASETDTPALIDQKTDKKVPF